MKNINEQIEKLQTELDELKAIANKPKAMIERVEDGELYCYINVRYEVVEDHETGSILDDERYSIGNYYTDRSLAERVAKYYRDNNMFIHKGIEIADGYEFEYGKDNYSVGIANSYITGFARIFKTPGTIYMTKQNAEKFKAWLEEYMPLD